MGVGVEVRAEGNDVGYGHLATLRRPTPPAPRRIRPLTRASGRSGTVSPPGPRARPAGGRCGRRPGAGWRG
ncbi:hypothetical protein PL81_25450 [Streptomyces sp. RSD-27]|nr:hypothetical protein PL81_25450 [Streptomyces sp. RSD-27]